MRRREPTTHPVSPKLNECIFRCRKIKTWTSSFGSFSFPVSYSQSLSQVRRLLPLFPSCTADRPRFRQTGPGLGPQTVDTHPDMAMLHCPSLYPPVSCFALKCRFLEWCGWCLHLSWLWLWWFFLLSPPGFFPPCLFPHEVGIFASPCVNPTRNGESTASKEGKNEKKKESLVQSLSTVACPITCLTCPPQAAQISWHKVWQFWLRHSGAMPRSFSTFLSSFVYIASYTGTL